MYSFVQYSDVWNWFNQNGPACFCFKVHKVPGIRTIKTITMSKNPHTHTQKKKKKKKKNKQTKPFYFLNTAILKISVVKYISLVTCQS